MSPKLRRDTLHVPSRAGSGSPNILVQDVDAQGADDQAEEPEAHAVDPSIGDGEQRSPSGTNKSGTEKPKSEGKSGVSVIVRSAIKTDAWCNARGVVIVQADSKETEGPSSDNSLMLPSQVKVPVRKEEVAFFQFMVEQLNLSSRFTANSPTLRPFLQMLKSTRSNKTDQAKFVKEARPPLSSPDTLYLLASLLGMSYHRSKTNPSPGPKKDTLLLIPKALESDELQDLRKKLAESNSLPALQSMPRLNEATIRSPVDAFLVGKIAVIEAEKDEIWLEPRYNMTTYIRAGTKRDLKIDPNTIVPDAALSVRISIDNRGYMESYGKIMGIPEAKAKFQDDYRHMMQIIGADLSTVEQGVMIWPILDFCYLLVEYKKKNVPYAHRQLGMQMVTALFFNHCFYVDTDQWPVYGLLVEGEFVTVYVGWLIPGDESSNYEPRTYIYQVCSNATTTAETRCGKAVRYCLTNVGDIVTFNRHIDLIRAYGEKMETKAEASVGLWLETLAEPKTYEKGQPHQNPFPWYHHQTMLNKKAAAPVAEVKQEEKVEQEAKVGEEMTRELPKTELKKKSTRRTKSAETDDQPRRAEGSRLTRSSTKAGGQS